MAERLHFFRHVRNVGRYTSLIFLILISFLSYGMEDTLIELEPIPYTLLEQKLPATENSSENENQCVLFHKPVLSILLKMLNENFEQTKDKTFLQFRASSKRFWKFSLENGTKKGEKLRVFLEKKLQSRENADRITPFPERWERILKLKNLGAIYSISDQLSRFLNMKSGSITDQTKIDFLKNYVFQSEDFLILDKGVQAEIKELVRKIEREECIVICQATTLTIIVAPLIIGGAGSVIYFVVIPILQGIASLLYSIF